MRFIIALWLARAVQLLLKILGKKATYFAGKVAITLCPDFLGRIGKPDKIIGVTGTNGKTTVNNLLTDALERLGVSVISNRYGSNINAGIATALISGSTLTGKPKKELAVLELDERSARLIYPYIKPDYLIITNLFRDSMRRNAHPEYISGLLTKHIPKDTKLIINADDLLAVSTAPENDRVYFGIEKLDGEPPERNSIVCDIQICPKCDAMLVYDFRRYNHIGRAHCPDCDFASPRPGYMVSRIDFENKKAKITEGENLYDYKLSSTLIYNVYNIIAVIATLRQLGYEHEVIARTLEDVHIVQSRFRQDVIKGKTLSAIMAKGLNAVACSRSFDYVGTEPGKKAVILMLDDVFDEKHSSENIAWLYDADFEFLNTPDIVQIITVGKRSPDSLLRLLIAGVEKEKITAVSSEAEAVDAVDLQSCDKIYILYELYRYDRAVMTRDRISRRIEAETEEAGQ
ncbi:MAG: DUF1727 domain-containing protein [Clostridiales bacterium]|nr:DUF1727 domain-containing protein [Clostridiales bacterium]